MLQTSSLFCAEREIPEHLQDLLRDLDEREASQRR